MKANSCRQWNNLFRILVLLAALCFVATLLASCGAEEQPREEGEMALSITSTAFRESDKIPDKYTCQGQNISPPLTWSEAPEGTQSFALIMDDPDAPGGVFTHWVIFNIPSDSRGLPEAVPTQDKLPVQSHRLLGEGQLLLFELANGITNLRTRMLVLGQID